MELKKCTKCGEVKEKLLENFARQKCKANSFYDICRKCRNIKQEESRIRKKQRQIEIDQKIKSPTKQCRICGIVKDKKYFFKYKKMSDGLFNECKSCCRKRNKINHHKRMKTDSIYKENMRIKSSKTYYKHKKKILVSVRKYQLKQYGINEEIYKQLKKQQNNVCAICHKPNKRKHKSGKKFDLHVDHNHKTGKIRGLLCSNCNLALGLFYDNSDLLFQASLYLKNK